MSLPVTPVAYNPPTIAQEAAAKASSEVGKRGVPRGVVNSLVKKSKRMASDFQESMQKHVKKKLDSMSGSQDNRKVGLKVAQFIPGKGLEVVGAQDHKDSSIYCSLGLKGKSSEDCWEKLFSSVKGKQISQDFAFKLICDPDLSGPVKDSRAVTFNCFRHYNPDSYNYRKTGFWSNVGTATGVEPSADQKKQSNRDWHSTLGPDAAFIRRSVVGLNADTNAGTWRGDDNDPDYDTQGGMANEWIASATGYSPSVGQAKISNSLVSPFRTPYQKELMYSRVNRQVLENYGFNLNPFRIDSFNTGQYWNDYSADLTPLRVYGCAGPKTMNFGNQKDTLNAANEPSLASSFVAKINTSINSTISNDFTEHSPVYEYHSQFGSGKLNYQFCNDGTNPVCIDICVIGVKKSEVVPLADFTKIANYNYAVNKFINAGSMNVGGYNSVSADDTKTVAVDLSVDEWCTDAKLSFIPNECFKNPQSLVDALDGAASTSNPNVREMFQQLTQGKKNPFKLVKRDQFIVSSGSSRSWSTTLPSINYRPQVYEDVEYPVDLGTAADEEYVASTGDEYTFMLAIGAHGLAVPVEEVYPDSIVDPTGSVVTNNNVGHYGIVDRQASSCNVSVRGTYTETVHPCYVENVGSLNFINGRLTEPYFDETPENAHTYNYNTHDYQKRLKTINIANQGQTVRTTQTGVTGVGAVTTQVGA